MTRQMWMDRLICLVKGHVWGKPWVLHGFSGKEMREERWVYRGCERCEHLYEVKPGSKEWHEAIEAEKKD